MKIAHFIDSPDPGGAETVVIDISRMINKRGYDAHVLHFGNQWLQEKCNEYGMENDIVPNYHQFTSVRSLPYFAIKFSRFLKHMKIDILHSHLFGAITGGALAARIAGIPHIGTIHDSYTIAEKKSRAHLLNIAARLGTRLVTVSSEMKTYIESLSKFSAGSIQIIPNGVDIRKFHNITRDYRKTIGLEEDDVVFTCVGRLVELKAHDLLIEAFSDAAEDKMKLLIVGEGPEKERCRVLIQSRGMERKIIMLGQRGDVPSILGVSDCFVLASRTEGLSCSVIEAMAAGLPVIATNVGGNPELIRPDETGYLIPTDNRQALSEAIQMLATDSGKRKSFGIRASEIAKEHYSLDAMINRYISNYQEMSVGRR